MIQNYIVYNMLCCLFLIHRMEKTLVSALQLLQLDTTQCSLCSRTTTVFKGSTASNPKAPVLHDSSTLRKLLPVS